MNYGIYIYYQKKPKITFRCRPRTLFHRFGTVFGIDLATISKTLPLGVRLYFAIKMINVYILARWRDCGLPR